MPFWSKKAKEREPAFPTEPEKGVSYTLDSNGHFIQVYGYRLPDHALQGCYARWKAEETRRREVWKAMIERDAVRCSAELETAAEAMSEVRRRQSGAASGGNSD